MKDKKYNNYFDNYSNKYKNTMIPGLIIFAIALVCYGGYELFLFIFKQ